MVSAINMVIGKLPVHPADVGITNEIQCGQGISFHVYIGQGPRRKGRVQVLKQVIGQTMLYSRAPEARQREQIGNK